MTHANLSAVSLRCALAALLLAGCGHRVGDSCKNNVDCSALGDRFCDVSAPGLNGDPGGYCTVEGCDVRFDDTNTLRDSCPSEAVCVRFFSQQQVKPCDPATQLKDCDPDERCLCDCAADPAKPNVCQPAGSTCANGTKVSGPKGGHCAPEVSERRWCMLKCKQNTDCREGYECRAAGTFGAELVPGEPNDGDHPPKFCVQRR